jgi:hypothetical protein
MVLRAGKSKLRVLAFGEGLLAIFSHGGRQSKKTRGVELLLLK